MRGTPEWEKLFGGCERILAIHIGRCVQNNTPWLPEVPLAEEAEAAAAPLAQPTVQALGERQQAVDPAPEDDQGARKEEEEGAESAEEEDAESAEEAVGLQVVPDDDFEKWRRASRFLSRHGDIVWPSEVEKTTGIPKELLDNVVDFQGFHRVLSKMSVVRLSERQRETRTHVRSRVRSHVRSRVRNRVRRGGCVSAGVAVRPHPRPQPCPQPRPQPRPQGWLCVRRGGCASAAASAAASATVSATVSATTSAVVCRCETGKIGNF